MSVFDTGSDQTTDGSQATESAFETETQPQDSFLNKLVETKGEQWSDPEVLAKGKLEADTYISTLESQLKELKEDLGKQDYAKSLLEQLQNRATDTTNVNTEVQSNNNNTSGTEAGNTTPDLSENTLKSLVEQTLTEREKQSTAKQNIDSVNQQLEQMYGTEAKVEIEKKAQALGMPVSRLQDIATESPTAFFTLIGEQRRDTQPMVTGTIRTEGVNMQSGNQERNWDYYQNLRRTNKNLYYSPKVQQSLLEDRKRLGNRFGL
jgi:DNA polymerase III alpha subunit (gram-positive type)